MSHDPLSAFEIEMYMLRARELRASYVADLSGRAVSAGKRWIASFGARDDSAPGVVSRILPVRARRHVAIAVAALAVLFLLGGFSALPSAPDPQGPASACAEREWAAASAIEGRAGVPDANDILGRAKITMRTARERCDRGQVTQAVSLYNYILRRVATLPPPQALAHNPPPVR